MQKAVLATLNPGKIREFQALSSLINLIPQSEYDIAPVDETGLTFVENALIKARHAAQHSGLPALADDSGLCVDALNGAPGLYSARYGDNLLTNLKHMPESKRTARFYCVLVFLTHPKDPTPLIAEGIWEGSILLKPQGTQGFGYDPIFYVPTHQCSAAELSPEVKSMISHRGMALKELHKKLKNIFS